MLLHPADINITRRAILTYSGQGCKKRGVKPAKHGIAVEDGLRARLLPGESALGFRPVRVKLTAPGEKLASESRVNYAKLVSVEHNVKVVFIGVVVQADFEGIVIPAVDQCWAKKKR